MAGVNPISPTPPALAEQQTTKYAPSAVVMAVIVRGNHLTVLLLVLVNRVRGQHPDVAIRQPQCVRRWIAEREPLYGQCPYWKPGRARNPIRSIT